jgi:hypothetical protein
MTATHAQLNRILDHIGKARTSALLEGQFTVLGLLDVLYIETEAKRDAAKVTA